MNRTAKKTTVRIKLNGGPWHGASHDTDSLDALKIIFTADDKAVVYVNQQDGQYLHSPDLSEVFSRDMDATYKKWSGSTFHIQTG